MTLAAAGGFVRSFPWARKLIARNSSLQEINIHILVGDKAIRRGSDERHNMARHEEVRLKVAKLWVRPSKRETMLPVQEWDKGF